MRTLLLFRGAPGAGKSTLIKKWGFENYTLSPDDMRMMYQSPLMGIDGKLTIGFTDDKKVWKNIREIAENRFKRGDFTVIDATNSQTHEILTWKNLAKKYKYRVVLVDLTTVPIEVCKEQNRKRFDGDWVNPSKVVPDEAIDKMYQRFATQPVPSGINVISPDEIDSIFWKPVDISEYSNVHIFGDIHGCYKVLNEYLQCVDLEKDFFIFVGDLCDRGVRNVEVVKFFMEHAGKPNFVFLEGNHEAHLKKWVKGEKGHSKEFNEHAAKELNKAQIKKKELSKALHRLRQCFWFKYKGFEGFVSHGGISVDPFRTNPLFISTETLIKGTGNYEDVYDVEAAYTRNMDDLEIVQIHGHRNPDKQDFDWQGYNFNLEGGVEFGGELRVLTFGDDDGYVIPQPVTLPNDEVRIEEKHEVASVEELVKEMRKSPYVQETIVGKDLTSFSFTSHAFRNGIWEGVITKARGLFINTEKNEIVARSYDKFFNLGEQYDPDYELRRLKFPVTAYEKYNGFLGILSWDEEANDLRFCSKSREYGKYSKLFKEAFYQSVEP